MRPSCSLRPMGMSTVFLLAVLRRKYNERGGLDDIKLVSVAMMVSGHNSDAPRTASM